jgi:hypothetical protein
MRVELYDEAIVAGAKKRLKIALRAYLYTVVPDSNDDEDTNRNDIENLVEQSLDAVDAVVHSYPISLGVNTLPSGS